jgi:serine/threonine protein kinase
MGGEDDVPFLPLDSLDIPGIQTASAPFYARKSVSGDLKEFRRIKLESNLKEPIETRKVNESIPSKLGLSKIPMFIIDRGFKNWEEVSSHREKLRQNSLTELNGKEDVILNACLYKNPANQVSIPGTNTAEELVIEKEAADFLIEYVEHCVTPACSVQAFLSLGWSIHQHRTSLFPLAVKLISKCFQNPEIIAYLIDLYDDDFLLAHLTEILFATQTLFPSTCDRCLPISSLSDAAVSKNNAKTQIFQRMQKLTTAYVSKSDCIDYRLLGECIKFSGSENLLPGIVSRGIFNLIEFYTAGNLKESITTIRFLQQAAVQGGKKEMLDFYLLDFLCGEIDFEGDEMRFSTPEPESDESEEEDQPKLNRTGSGVVPLLKFNGLPPSVQGCGSIGAVPGEELSRLSQGTVKGEEVVSVYEKIRCLRLIYNCDELHFEWLKLFLLICLDHKNRHILDDKFLDPYPLIAGKRNFLFFLDKHINHPKNHNIKLRLFQDSQSIKCYAGLLRLISLSEESSWFSGESQFLGGGAFGNVYKLSPSLFEASQGEIAVKVFEVTRAQLDRSHFYHIYSEFRAMEIMACNFSGVPKVLDCFGLSNNRIYMVMECFDLSCDRWLSKFSPSQSQRLEVFRQVMEIVRKLHTTKITHYDIKSGNILFRVLPDFTECVLGDFGESLISKNEDERCLLNRGTEYLKSPEMLTISNKVKDKFDRRKPKGTTQISDIWSLGVFFYEVLTGTPLFNDSDWIMFFIKVTQSDEILTEEDLAVFKEAENSREIEEFLRFLLIRDPVKRPNIEAVCRKFYELFEHRLKDFKLDVFSDKGEQQMNLYQSSSMDFFQISPSVNSAAFNNQGNCETYKFHDHCTLRVISKDPPTFASDAEFVIIARSDSRQFCPPFFCKTLEFHEISEKSVSCANQFLRLALFNGCSLEIVCTSDTFELGVCCAVSLIATTLKKCNLTAACIEFASCTRIPVSEKIRNALNSLANVPFKKVASNHSLQSCLCGCVEFEFPERLKEISWSEFRSDMSVQDSGRLLTCLGGECCLGGQGCSDYKKWKEQTYPSMGSKCQWMVQYGVKEFLEDHSFTKMKKERVGLIEILRCRHCLVIVGAIGRNYAAIRRQN